MDHNDQTSFYIPYHEDSETSDSDYSTILGIDLPDGYELRLTVYKQAWAKTHARIQDIIRKLHSPVALDIVQQVREAYTDALPGLPLTELPVITVSAQGGGSSVLQDVAIQLETGPDDSDDEAACAILVHLYPTDCPNIATAMKAMIMSFINSSLEGRSKLKTTSSLATYDIELLKAWYASPGVKNDPPQLVVMLHEFEQFDPNVVQDMFYICSLHIPQLPLVFILSLSSPSEPSYLHATYARTALALLRVKNFTVSSGVEVLEEIISKTFFDLEFHPDVVLGPVVLDFITEYFVRHNCSLDAIVTVIQLTYMKHVDEPLTIFVDNQAMGTKGSDYALLKLQEPKAFPFLEYLFSRLLASFPDASEQWKSGKLSSLFDAVADTREEFRSRYRTFKIGFGLFMKIRKFMLGSGYKTLDPDSALDIMNKGLKGRLVRDWKYLGTVIKKLNTEQLRSLLEQVEWFFQDTPEGIFEQEEEARFAVASLQGKLSMSSEASSSREIAAQLSDWFIEYSAAHLGNRLDECRLWDIWYTGSTPFPSELLNPAPRARITAALSHPEDYCEVPFDFREVENECDVKATSDRAPPDFSELPDTSILFRRYLEGGRMINVYDWFESFAVVLENQREQLQDEEDDELPQTPSKSRKEKSRAKQQSNQDDEEMWSMEVQARFIRAVHELDFMGLIKHTGRKTDHVMKTIFEVPD